MPQPRFLTGVDADITLGNSVLIGARWAFRETTDFLPANRLGVRFKTYGIGQTGGMVTVQAPWEENVNPFDNGPRAGDTGKLTISVEDQVQATCEQVGVLSAEITTDADGVTVWAYTFICMGDFEDFSSETDADGRDPGPNE